MAHVARLNDLTASLVSSITGWDRNANEYKQAANETSRALKGSGHARTNPFDINSKLSGLVEKFTVLNREDLADELQTRLDELTTQSKWLPEVLSLLLMLSDRPLEKTSLEDFESIVQLSEDEQEPTWKEIFADHSGDDTGLWDGVERGYHSSGDESSADDENVTTSTNATSVQEEDLAALAKLHVFQPDESSLESVKEFRDRLENDASDEVGVSELFIIRESLSMMQGLPTSLYNVDHSSGTVSGDAWFNLQTSTKAILSDILVQLAGIGSSLNYLRSWLRTRTRLLYLQSCKAAIQRQLGDFQARVTAVAARYASPQGDIAVSLISVSGEVESLAKPLLFLTKVVRESERGTSASLFTLLDLLYEEICMTQMAGDLRTLEILVDIFTAGLRTYLRPLSLWIQNGNLHDSDGTFFIIEGNTECSLSNMWHDRFAIRRLANRKPSVPAFLEVLTDRVFALGKSRAFLRALNTNADPDEMTTNASPPNPESITRHLNSTSLMPFSQLLHDALDSWISAIGHDCNPMLCRMMLYEHGILTTLNGMATVFCSQNGRLFQTFADTLFWRMDAGKNWQDSFLLSELSQSTLGSTPDVSAEALSISITDEGNDLPTCSVAQLGTIWLESLLAWPIQNITRSATPSSYSEAFTLLLQIYRIKYLLRRQTHTVRGLGKQKQQFASPFAAALRIRQYCVVAADILHNHITNTSSILSAAVSLDMKRADGVDTMSSVWIEHERQMRFSLLLMPNLKPLKDAVINVLQLCEQFCELWNRLSSYQDLLSEAGNDENRMRDGSRSGRSSMSAHRSLLNLQADLTKSMSFLSAGVRATGRVAGSVALEALSDQLERCIDYQR